MDLTITKFMNTNNPIGGLFSRRDQYLAIKNWPPPQTNVNTFTYICRFWALYLCSWTKGIEGVLVPLRKPRRLSIKPNLTKIIIYMYACDILKFWIVGLWVHEPWVSVG